MSIFGTVRNALGGAKGGARELRRGMSSILDVLDLIAARNLGHVPKSMPLLYIELLRRCNLRCVTCGFSSDYPDDGPEMTTEQVQCILRESLKLHTKIVSFGGGEPFLRGDLPELIETCENLGLAAHVNTNGTCISDETVARLAEFRRLALVFSLDHPNPEQNDFLRGSGVFEKVRDVVAKLKDRAPAVHLGLNCVVSHGNVHAMEDMVHLAARWSVDSVKFTPFHDNLNHRWRTFSELDSLRLSPTDLPALARQVERIPELARRFGLMTNSRAFLEGMLEFAAGRVPELPCYAGYMYGNIDPYGRLFPCYDHREPLNVLDLGLVASWRSPAMEQMRTRVRSCTSRCWNTGNAEPSIRLHPATFVLNPGQAWEDLRFYLFLSAKR